MARVLVASQPWGLLWEKDGNRNVKIPLAGQAASINTTVYAAATGTGTVSFVTNADGELPGYVDEGSWTLTVGAETFAAPAVAGVSGGHPRKPASGAGVAYVDPSAGDDANDGLSWGSAKATIAAAVTSITRGTIELARGTYSLSAAVSLPNFVSLHGQGQDTLLRCTGNHYAINLNPANRVKISNLMIDAATAQTSGGGIDWTNAANNVWISDLYLGSNLHTSLNIAPAVQGGIYILERIRWNGIVGCTTGIRVGDGATLVTDVYISHAIGTAASISDMSLWVDIARNTDTVHLTDSLFYVGSRGCEIGVRGTAGRCTNSKMTATVFDNMDLRGIYVERGMGFNFVNCAVQGCGTTAMPGVDVGATSESFAWVGGVIHQNESDGLIIRSGSKDTLLTGVQFLNNNRTNQTFGSGVSVAAGASDWSVVGCTLGNVFTNGNPALQKYGVLLGGGATTNFVIQGNRFPGNVTAAYTIGSNITGNGTVGGNIPEVSITIASAATLVLRGNPVTFVSGSTNITSITAQHVGARVTLISTGTWTLTDGGNLKLAGDFVSTADDSISLICDGTNWIETARSVN